MNVRIPTIDESITTPLSRLLGLEITHAHIAIEERGSSGSVFKVVAFDNSQIEHPLVLKKSDDDRDFRLYEQYLKPYSLNSPKHYGYIETNNQPFLVMDYIKHAPPDWNDGHRYLEAVTWLIKKDLITSQNLSTVRDLDCLGKPKYHGTDYWLPIFEEWRGSPIDTNIQANNVWNVVNKNKNRINEYIDELSESGTQTVVHGDMQMDNILFGDDIYQGMLFVIDWTEPHIGSVTTDLASLYDNAPASIRVEMIRKYREHVDFHHFDEIFAKARVLRDIGYLSWMVWMINEGDKEEDYQDELNRVSRSLISALC
jgi:aminoglycoside phosphotransferase (APT) family kinase protein